MGRRFAAEDGSHVSIFYAEESGYEGSGGRELFAKGAVLCIAIILCRVYRHVK